jgi:hypothetical protein
LYVVRTRRCDARTFLDREAGLCTEDSMFHGIAYYTTRCT